MEEVDVTVVGAGIVGLAVAAYVAKPGRTVAVLEKNTRHGQETSSRSSEVIHAGIHYPPGSLKATLCVRGKQTIYSICRKFNIPCRRTGKIIVAKNQEEAGELEKIQKRGAASGVEDLRLLDSREMRNIEPSIRAFAGLISPSTGIVDSERLMGYFLAQANKNGAIFVFGSEAFEFHPFHGGYEVRTRGIEESFRTRVLINSSGLSSDRLAEAAGVDIHKAGYRLHYCKGEYFRIQKPLDIKHLIYPVPERTGLGTHLTADLSGRLKLGPNAVYVDQIDYSVPEEHRRQFCESAAGYLPGLREEDIHPDFAGIRPKLQGPGETFRDFVIAHEAARGLPGLINLIGIDSPGLTSSPAIGELVAEFVEEML